VCAQALLQVLLQRLQLLFATDSDTSPPISSLTASRMKYSNGCATAATAPAEVQQRMRNACAKFSNAHTLRLANAYAFAYLKIHSASRALYLLPTLLYFTVLYFAQSARHQKRGNIQIYSAPQAARAVCISQDRLRPQE